MALARFFPRVANSAAAALTGFDAGTFEAALGAQRVDVAFDRHAAGTPEGRACLDLCVRLVARLYPIVSITALARGAGRYRAKLLDLAKAINPRIEIGFEGAPTARIVVGQTAVDGALVLYAGSEGWICRFSTAAPVGCGATEIPFGAGASACLANANLFRAIFGAQLSGAELDTEVAWSLWDHVVGEAARNPVLQGHPDLQRTQLVGAGAIGNGAVWALARYSGLRGELDVIDPEPIDVSNLQRYVLALDRDEGAEKPDLAVREVPDGGLVVRSCPQPFDGYLAGRNYENLERVAVALDTAEERIRVQGALPRKILNSWTQAGDLAVSRHTFGDGPCLACLYMPRSERPSEDELIAQAIGLPEPGDQRMEIRALLMSGAAVGETFVRKVAERLSIPPERLLQFSEAPLRTFYAEAVCGGLVIGLKRDAKAQVPLAFQSALAGVMLAAEIVADAAGRDSAPLRDKTVVDVLRPLGSWLNLPVPRTSPAAPARCICQDEEFLAAYQRRYGCD